MKFKFWERRSASDGGSGLEILEGPDANADTSDAWLMTDEGQLISQQANPEAFAVMLTTGKARTVSRDVALSVAAVYACVDRIASNIAMMPVSIKQVKGGQTRDVTQHDAAFLWGSKPNDWQTPYALKQALLVDVLTDGNMYCNVVKTRRGGIDKLRWFDARAVGLYNVGPGRWTYDATDDEGNQFTIFPEDMAHVRALGNKGRKGLSPIRLHADLFNMGLDTQDYGSSFFAAGGKPSGIVGVKQVANDKSMDNLKETWRRASNMADTNNKTIFLPADITYTAMSISPVDAKIVEMMGLNRSQIGGIYNVPLYMIGETSTANVSNITQQAISFVRNTLQPWITAIEDELNVKTFTRDELANGLRHSFDMDILMRGTPVERAQIAHYAITDGWKSRNEVRVEEGYSRVEGQDMDKYLTSVNAVQQSKNGDNTDGDNNDQKGLQNGDNLTNPNGDDIQIKEK